MRLKEHSDFYQTSLAKYKGKKDYKIREHDRKKYDDILSEAAGDGKKKKKKNQGIPRAAGLQECTVIWKAEAMKVLIRDLYITQFNNNNWASLANFFFPGSENLTLIDEEDFTARVLEKYLKTVSSTFRVTPNLAGKNQPQPPYFFFLAELLIMMKGCCSSRDDTPERYLSFFLSGIEMHNAKWVLNEDSKSHTLKMTQNEERGFQVRLFCLHCI